MLILCVTPKNNITNRKKLDLKQLNTFCVSKLISSVFNKTIVSQDLKSNAIDWPKITIISSIHFNI